MVTALSNQFQDSAAGDTAADTAAAPLMVPPDERGGQPSMADAPFHCPPDIVLDLPVPISVNKLRRIDWRNHQRAALWKDQADRHLLVAKRRAIDPVKLTSVERFEINIVLSEDKVRSDADNIVKLLVDYLRHRNIIKDDGPKHMRRLVVEWGDAPTGCRVTIRPLASGTVAS